MSNNTITAIDLGSNSFRVVVYDFLENKIVDEYQAIVGLAEAIPKTGKISKESQKRVINAILDSSKKIKYNPKRVVAVTTAAMRYASNSKEAIKNFKEKTGINFKIIEPNEEARLTLLAAKYALKREKIKQKNFIVLDIGGGSTELVINSCNKHIAKSFNYGIVTIANKYNDIKKLNKKTKELKELKKELKEFLATLDKDLKDYIFIATSGTPTILACTKVGLNANSYDRNKINGLKLKKNEVKTIYKKFSKKNRDEMRELLGDVKLEYIKVGTLIYMLLYKVLKKKCSLVFDDGLREGVAIDYFLKKKS